MKKTASLIFSAFLSMTSGLASAHEKKEIYSQTTHYELNVENGIAKTMIVRSYMLLQRMNWTELSVRVTFEKDAAGNEKVAEVIVWPDNTEVETPEESEIVFRLNQDPKVSSFINFLNSTKFKESEVLPLLDLFGYLYDKRAENMKFESQNLFDSEPGNMRSKLSKKINPEGNVVSIESMNASGNTNAWIDVTTKDKPGKLIENILVRMKFAGIIFSVTRIEEVEK